MDFNYAGELLKLCEETKLPISEVMKRREMDFSSMTAQEVEEKMRKSLEIMKTAAKEPLENEKPSMGGLIGVGFHDATWQTAFGGTLYQIPGTGSHGCINMPLDQAGALFNMIEPGTPVIFHW